MKKILSVKYFIYNPFMNELLAANIAWFHPDVVVRALIIYFFIVWFCIVVWVVRDVTNRTKSIVFQVLSILLVLFLTPLGIFIYLLLRPQKTLFEQIFEEEFLRLDEEFQKSEPHSRPKHSAGMDIARKTR